MKSIDLTDKYNEGTVAYSSHEKTNTKRAINSANVVGMTSQQEEIKNIDKTCIPQITTLGQETNSRKQLQLNSKEVVDTPTMSSVSELSKTYPKQESANLSSTSVKEKNMLVFQPVELKEHEIVDQVDNLNDSVSLQTKADIKIGNINNPMDKEEYTIDEYSKELNQHASKNKRANTANVKEGSLERVRSVEKRMGQDLNEQDAVELKINKVKEQRASTGKCKKEAKQKSKSTERMVGIDISLESTEELISTKQPKIRAEEKIDFYNKVIPSKTSYSMVSEDIPDSVSQFEVSSLEQESFQTNEKANNKKLALKKSLSLVDNKKEESIKELDVSQPLTTLKMTRESQNKNFVVKESVPVVDNKKEESIQDMNSSTPWFLKQAKTGKDQGLKSVATKEALPVGVSKSVESTEVFKENLPTKNIKVTIEEDKVRKVMSNTDHQIEEIEEKFDTYNERTKTATKSKTLSLGKQQALKVPKLIGVRVKCNLMH